MPPIQLAGLAVMRSGEAMRLARTVAQLRPGQAGQRLRLRAQRVALERRVPAAERLLLAGPDPATAVGWTTGFTPLDMRSCPGPQAGRASAALQRGDFSLLGVTRTVAPAGPSGAADWEAADWTQPDAPLLWRYHLYYWDWAWALAGTADGTTASDGARGLFAAIWQSWHAAVAPGRGHAWHPYPAALRAWSFCGLYRALVADGPLRSAFLTELAQHVGFLRRSMETDVGGNHLMKNLKALIGLALFFADAPLLARALGRLHRQLDVQVLPDGGHYERAPAYHCQVLGDLIDIDALLHAAGRNVPPRLPAAIAAMRRWLGVVLTPEGQVPLLNDGFPVSPGLLPLLGPVRPPGKPLQLLPETGLARVTAGHWHLLADFGPPCPRELPAHAHADTLSCLVHVAGAPLLIDTGTSTYAAGTVRDRERSTAAHNTLEVDRCDSTEVWGAFRAGRRARPRDATAWVERGTVTVEAEHDGYRCLPGRPVHRRRWTLSPGGLRVDDTVSGGGRHRLVVRWHVAPGARLRLVPGGAEVATETGRFAVSVTAALWPANPVLRNAASGGPVSGGPALEDAAVPSRDAASTNEPRSRGTDPGRPRLTVECATLGKGFEINVVAPVLTCVLDSELPVRISTVWRQIQPIQPRQEST